MTPARNSMNSAYRGMPVPVMIQMLYLLEKETQDDIVLAGVSRTLSQAIDELSALQSAAMSVMCEMAGPDIGMSPSPLQHRRRLC